MTGENEIEQEKSGQTRLEAFEKMLSAVQQNYQDTLDKMEQLKNQGKVKSVTYRQLMGTKLMYQNMLSLYQVYGILHHPL